MKSKIAQNRSYGFVKNFGSKRDSPQQINCENFIIGCTVGFRTIFDQGQVFRTLDENWIEDALYLSARSCDAMYQRKSKLELFYGMFINFFSIFFGLWAWICIWRSLQLLLHIPKRFNAFQVLKWFLLVLEVTSIIFTRATNDDVWQAFVARAN